MFPTGHPLIDPILWTLFTMWVIFRASDAFETASEYIGRHLREGVRGATINAIASSIPELLTTIFFLLYLGDEAGFASGIGTTAGSAIFNGMIIPAAVIITVLLLGVATHIKVSRKVLLRDGLALIICEIFLILIISSDQLNWWHGLLLMLVYFTYVVFMIKTMKRDGGTVQETIEKPGNQPLGSDGENTESAWKFWRALFTIDLATLVIGKRMFNNRNAWSLLVLSTMIIGAACFLLVFACEQLGEALHLEVYFIAVILAAAATSVPDTIISIKDGMRGNYDDAISNALGSNIFDICFALGFPLFIYSLFEGPIVMQEGSEVGELRVILLFLTIAALLIYLIGKYMNMFKAILLLTIYIFFVLYIVGKSLDNDTAMRLSAHIQSLLNWVD